MVVPIALHVKRNVAHALGGHSTLNARQHIQIKGTYMLMSSLPPSETYPTQRDIRLPYLE
jgi:hypothetical protein